MGSRAAVVLALCLGGGLALGALTPAQQAAPAGPGEPAPVTLYGHLFNLGGDERGRLVNAQFPDGESDLSLALGNTGGLPTPGGYNIALRSTAGLVQVKSREEFDAGGADRLHPEAGFTKDILLDTTKPGVAYLYFSTDDTPVFIVNSSPGDDLPGYYPDVDVDWGARPQTVVVTSIRADQEIGGQSNPLVTQGRSAAVDMISLPETIPGMRFVYEFEVPLDPPQVALVPGHSSGNQHNLVFNVIVRSLEREGQAGFGIGNVAVNSGEAYPPRWTVWTKNPVDVELVYPRFAGDKLVVLGIFNSPFGSYDVDRRTLSIAWEGPSQPASVRKPILDYSVAHGGHFDPVNATWAWDFGKDQAQPGRYEVTVSAMNGQRTGRAETSAFFTIEKGQVAGKTQSGTGGIATFAEEDVNETLGATPEAEQAPASGIQPRVGAAKEEDEGFLPGFELLGAALAMLGLAAWRRWR